MGHGGNEQTNDLSRKNWLYKASVTDRHLVQGFENSWALVRRRGSEVLAYGHMSYRHNSLFFMEGSDNERTVTFFFFRFYLFISERVRARACMREQAQRQREKQTPC